MGVRHKRILSAFFAIMLLFISAGASQALSRLPATSMRIGSQGEPVRLLQENLTELDLYGSIVDGVYGARTAAAVRLLQARLGIDSDGICGIQTINAFNSAFTTLQNGTFAAAQAQDNAQAGAASPTEASPTEASLSGKRIGIDAGHQKNADHTYELVAPGSMRSKERMSAGAVGIKTNVPEYEITLLVAKKLQSLLEKAGAVVFMTRTENDVQLSNIERAQAVNDADVDCWVRIHCDYSTDRAVNGVHVLCPSSVIKPEIADDSLKLAKKLLASVCEATGAAQLSVLTKTDQTGFNWSWSPVATVELGYLSNPTEDVRLNRTYYQQYCAEGIYKGLTAYFSTT